VTSGVSAPTVPTATVVGGGPAGLMAAEVLAGHGVAVTVFEHMPSVGRKLLLAGRGGLNLTHSEDPEVFLTRYGTAADRLTPVLAAFDAEALRGWAAELGEPTFVGSSGRVFPQSFRATPLLRAWLARLAGLGVRFETRHRWIGFGAEPTEVRVAGPDGERSVASDVVVLALGGPAGRASAPTAAGSTSSPRRASRCHRCAPRTSACASGGARRSPTASRVCRSST
jgi:predicted flavoprotein YhiN